MADLRTIDLRKLQERISSPSSFRPTEDQRRARSAFWSSQQGEVPPNISLALAARFAGSESIVEWWEQPGFVDWFSDSQDFIKRIDYLAHRSLDQLELVLTTSDNHDTVLKAVRMIMELARRFPPKQASDTAGAFLDAQITKMSREQLREFIASRTARLMPSPPETEEDK